MANYNKVMLMGNLTRDPQLSYTPNQTAIVDFGMAINRKWKGQDGTMHEDTCFVDCTSFGRQAETINKYLSKGRPVFVEGRLTFDSWTAQDGTKRSKLKVTVENFQFLPTGGQGGGGQAPGAPGGGGGGQGYGGGGQGGGNSYRDQQSGPDHGGSQVPPQGGDDDIPF